MSTSLGAPRPEGAAPLPLVVRSPTVDQQFTQCVRDHFVGFDQAGNTRFVDDYITKQHKILRCYSKGAAHDALLYDLHQWRETSLYGEGYQKVNIDRQMALSVSLPQGESLLVFGYAEANVPALNGERHQLLSTLLPAFEGNVYFRQRLSDLKANWTTRLDQVEEALAVFSTDGKEHYRNHALRRLLAAEPQADVLISALCHFVTQLQTIIAPRPDRSASTTQNVTVGNQPYRMRGYPDRFLLPTPALIISIEWVSVLPSSSSLRSTFGLTVREVEVTQLLVQGYSDREIAERLSISLHTAHRHSESVLRKINISSRAGIAHTCLMAKQ